jgi:prefoldin subunit 5
MSAITRIPESNNEIRLAMETQSAQKYLQELHTENIQDLSELALAKDEIKTYISRLSEVVSANTGKEVLAEVEHFQNQFIRHNEVIDELNAEIHHNQKAIAALAEANNVATDHRKTNDHTELRDEMIQFKKIFGELRMTYLQFLAKTF